jgi:REP element-mobilizing transposase RayT
MSKKARRSKLVPHSVRPDVDGAIHVVLRVRRGLPGLRTPRAWRVLERAFRRGKDRNGMRLLQFSVQEDHLHLVVDVCERTALSRGMQGLAIRLAKALNKRKGNVFADRYYGREVESRSELRRVVRYVLMNAKKHGTELPGYEGQPDPYSSARWFLFWNEPIEAPRRSPPVVREHFWRGELCGWIRLKESPGDSAIS